MFNHGFNGQSSATGAKSEEEIVSFATKQRRYWGRCREARLVKSFEKIAEVAKIWSSPRCQLLRGQPPILQTYINIWVRLAKVLGACEYIRHSCCQHFCLQKPSCVVLAHFWKVLGECWMDKLEQYIWAYIKTKATPEIEGHSRAVSMPSKPKGCLRTSTIPFQV